MRTTNALKGKRQCQHFHFQLCSRRTRMEKFNFNQCLTVAVLDIFAIVTGMSIGFSAPLGKLFASRDSPLASGPANVYEISLMNSIPTIGSLVSVHAIGFLMHKFGKRSLLLCVAVIMMISNCFLIPAQTLTFVFISRLLGGVTTAAVYQIVPLFIVEIASPTSSGFLSSTFTVCVNIGIFLEFITADYVDFRTLAVYTVFLVASGLVGVALCHDTPECLMSRGKIRHYQQACQYYGLRPLSTCVTMSSPKIKHGLLTTAILCLFPVFSGAFVLMTFTHLICEQLSISTANYPMPILLTLVQIIGSCIATASVDAIGKKMLLIISLIGTICGFFILTLHAFIDIGHSFDLVALVAMISIIFFCSVGVIPIPFFYAAEMFTGKGERIKNLTMGSFLMWAAAFIELGQYLPLQKIVGPGGIYAIFLSTNVGCLLFTLTLPKTRGINESRELATLNV